MKTIDNLLATRSWISHIDDERGDGSSIIVTLAKGWVFDDERDCGVRGFDTIKELRNGTTMSSVYWFGII